MFIDTEKSHAFVQATRRRIRSQKGISLLEAVIAVFLTTVGIFAIMSLQPTAWSTAAKSDHLGRAAMILSQELEKQQALIMNPCNAVFSSPDQTTKTTSEEVRPSGGTASVEGDMVYTVTTTVTLAGSNIYTVMIQVVWNNGANEVKESMTVCRQETWRYPEGCTSAL